jgi:hypothetical protein
MNKKLMTVHGDETMQHKMYLNNFILFN